MKSPFVRFSQCIRSPFTVAAIGLCSAWGCRHLPTIYRGHSTSGVVDHSAAANAGSSEWPSVSYEEIPYPDASVIDPRCIEHPLVPAPADAQPASELPKSLISPETLGEPKLAPTEPAPVTAKPVEKPAAKPAKPEAKEVKPAPNGKLDVPPEPESKSKPKPNAQPDNSKSDKEKSEAPKETATSANAIATALSAESKSIDESLNTESEDFFPQSKTENVDPFQDAAAVTPLFGKAQSRKVTTSKVLASVSQQPVTEKADLEKVDLDSSGEPALENEVLSLASRCDGLVFDANGFGYVSHRHRIVRFSPTGEATVWATLGSPKGHRIEPEGTHLVCDSERRSVLRLSFEGKVVAVVAKECDGAPLRAPCDVAVDPRGGFYFTDSGDVQTKNPVGKLHFVNRTGKVSVVAAKIGLPTGVVYDPVRLRVLVAESQFNRILEFRLAEPGKVESFDTFVQLPRLSGSDDHLASLCLDAEGNLYVTQQQSKTVHVFDPQGRAIGKFSTGNVIPSAVALRSSDADELFLAGELDSQKRTGKIIRVNLGK